MAAFLFLYILSEGMLCLKQEDYSLYIYVVYFAMYFVGLSVQLLYVSDYVCFTIMKYMYTLPRLLYMLFQNVLTNKL